MSFSDIECTLRTAPVHLMHYIYQHAGIGKKRNETEHFNLHSSHLDS